MNKTRFTDKAIGRRAILRGAVTGVSALGVSVLLGGCGDDDDSAGAISPSAASSAAASSSAVAPTPAGKPGGSVTMYNTSDLQRLDFQQTISTPTQNVMCMVHNRLLEPDPNAPPNSFQIRSDLAESYELTGDKLIFHLRQGVKWQDLDPVNGRTLVAADVKYTLERLRTSGADWVWAYKLTSVGQIEAPDDHTVVLNLNEPSAVLLSDLAHGPGMGIIAQELVEADGGLDKRWVGTGPFILSKYDKGNSQEFIKNPNYFRSGLPYLDSAKVVVIKDTATALAQFLARQISQYSPSPEEVDRVESDLKVKATRYLALTTSNFNYGAGPSGTPEMRDLRVRQAIDCAIDRQAIVDLALGGDGVWGGPIIPSGYAPWSLPDDFIHSAYKQDLNKAKQLLSQAGVTSLTLPLMYSNVDVFAGDTAPLIKQDLAKVGITVNLMPEERAVYLQRQVDADFQFQLVGSGTGPDPDSLLTPYWHSGDEGGKNWAQISDPELDARIEAARQTMVQEERIPLVQAIAKDWNIKYLYRTQVANRYVYNAWQPNVRAGFDFTRGADWRGMEGVWLA